MLTNKINDKELAILLFIALFASWAVTKNDQVWGLVNTIFGVVVGFLTAKVMNGSSKPPDAPNP